MVEVLSSDILDSKVVNNQSEGDWSCGLYPQHRCVAARSVSVLFQVGFEAVVCIFPACFRPGMPLRISIYTQPFTAILRSSYCVIISSVIMSRLMRTYSYSSTVMGVP